MKILKKLIAAALIALFAASCTQENKVFQVNLKKIEDGYKVTYLPPVAFKDIPGDSTRHYMTEQDMYRIMGGPIKKATRLLSASYFDLHVMSLQNYGTKPPSSEIFLRTISNDFKIIDTIKLGATTDSPAFSGFIDPDGKITRTYTDGRVEHFELADNGTFKKVGDE